MFLDLQSNMNQKDKDFIRTNYINLSNAITPEVEGVIDRLYMQRIISGPMKERLLENSNTKRRKARDLLDLIITRGTRALDFLYQAVLDEQLFDAANILRPGSSPSPPAPLSSAPLTSPTKEESDDKPLPDSWPNEEDINNSKAVRLVEAKHVSMRARFQNSLLPIGQEETYLMSGNPRGHMLIFNNEEFDSLSRRDGTSKDRIALDKLFKSFGFKPVTHKNTKAADMWRLLQEEAKLDYHKQANCFVLFILSHGHKDVVFGTDGEKKDNKLINCIEIKAIVDLFSHCRALQGKPKLFFIQACQGGEKNKGEPIGEAGGGDSASSAEPKHTSANMVALACSGGKVEENDGEQDINLSTQEVLTKIVSDVTKSDSVDQKRPSGADVFVAMATIPGFLSWRNTKQGTWFIQAIVYVFANYAYKYDLLKLMTMVNNLVGRAETEKGRYKQVGEKKDTLNKDLYFFPGL